MQKDKKIYQISKYRAFILLGIGTVVLVLGVVLFKVYASENNDPSTDIPVFVVEQGPLRINVMESGTINSSDQVIIKSEVEGRTTILSIVKEGSQAKKGDLLVELDASTLQDNRIDQQIKVQNAEAASVQAKENLAVVQNQAQSDINKAELALEFAKQDLEKYKVGEYQNELTAAKVKIKLAEEKLQQAQENLEWSQKLINEKYISQTEFKRDQLTANTCQLDCDLAKSDLWLLENYTYKRTMAQLVSDVNQAEMAMERTTRKAKADIIQAEAELRAKDSEFNRQQDKLKKIDDQIIKTKIYAPADGLVIYATSASGGPHGNQEPLEEGQEVRERQELIYLPTTSSMKAVIKIHESSMKKVKLGMPARISVETMPGKVFKGHVSKIAPLPDAQSMWLNPDLKVFNTEILIDDDGSELHTGMSCKADIIVEDYENAIYIPVWTVVRVKNQPTVFIPNGKINEPRAIETGLDNTSMIHVISGLKPGETILLNPPLTAGITEQSASIDEAEKQSIKQSQTLASPSSTLKPDQNTPPEKQKTDDQSQTPPKKRNLTPEQIEKMKKEYENMSPEEREKALQKFQKRNQDREKKQ